MQKSNNTLAQLNENNFDILNNGSMGMIKGGTYYNPCGNGSNGSKKSNKKNKSKKSKKYNHNSCNPCGW